MEFPAIWNFRLLAEHRWAAGPGTLVYFPPDVVHSTVALPDEDVVFFAVKDLTHRIAGRAADGTMSGPHYEPGFQAE